MITSRALPRYFIIDWHHNISGDCANLSTHQKHLIILSLKYALFSFSTGFLPLDEAFKQIRSYNLVYELHLSDDQVSGLTLGWWCSDVGELK